MTNQTDADRDVIQVMSALAAFNSANKWNTRTDELLAQARSAAALALSIDAVFFESCTGFSAVDVAKHLSEPEEDTLAAALRHI